MPRGWLLIGCVLAYLAVPTLAQACDWLVQGSTRVLIADCSVTEGIDVPDGVTIDGGNHRVSVVDPPGDVFRGAVFTARGKRAHVRDLILDGNGLGRGCEEGRDRLVGIRFDGASGTIDGVSVQAITRLDGECGEGIGIEIVGRIRGRGPGEQAVAIHRSVVRGYQKAGLVVGGAVFVEAHDNEFAAGDGAVLMPSNGIQVAFGARAVLMRNRVAGASWCCTEDAGTGILLLEAAPGTELIQNRLDGNADVGIFAIGRAFHLDRNEVIDRGADALYDVGILLMGEEHVVRGNHVEGFTVPQEDHRREEPSGMRRSVAQ